MRQPPANDLLAGTHHPVPVQLLPGEAILWRGAPSRRVMRVQVLVDVFSAVLALAFLIGLDVVLMKARDNCARDTTMATQTAGARSPADDASRSVGCRPSSEALDPAAANALAAQHQTAASRHARVLAALFAVLLASHWIDTYARMRRSTYLVTSERILIQTAGVGAALTVLDIDRIVSIQSRSGWLMRWIGLHSVEFIHAGTSGFGRVRGVFAKNPYEMWMLDIDSEAFSQAVNAWLPRDSARRPHPDSCARP